METVLLYTVCICVVVTAILGAAATVYRRRYYNSQYYNKTAVTFYKIIMKKEFRSIYRLSCLLEAMPFEHETLYHCKVPQDNNNVRMAEIDCLVLSCKGIYVIINENYCGNICGDEKHPEWRVEARGRRRYFENPVKKNLYRIDALCTYLDISSRCCKSLIAFHTGAVLKRIRIKSTRTFVTRARDLDIYFDSEKNKPDVLPACDMYSYYGKLRRQNAPDSHNECSDAL